MDHETLIQRIVMYSRFQNLEVLGSLIHEANNRLNFILGPVEDLEEVLSERGHAGKDEIQVLRDVRATILELSGIFKSFGRIYHVAENDSPDWHLSGDLLKNSVDIIRKRLKRNHVNVEMGTVAGESLYCDGNTVCHVLMSLISNAVEAMENVQERWIRVSGEVENDRFAFTVTDSGLKPNAEVKSKMFSPFFTTKNPQHHLGIALCYGRLFARSSGGDLIYDHEREETTFRLFLPLGG